MSALTSPAPQTARAGLSRYALAVFFAVLLLLPGCASFLDPGTPPTRIQLHPAMPDKAQKSLNKQLIVAMPEAGRDIDSDNIALLFNGREIRHLAGVRWALDVPRMVQSNLIDALLFSEGLRGVADETSGISANAKVLCDIRQFCLRYDSENAPPTAWFAATFNLVDQSNGRVLGSKTIDITVPSSGTDTPALAKASEAALGKGLSEVTVWILETMREK